MGELPTGTVTFLFTDIEGSTRLLQEIGDRYVPLRDRHNEIVRRAIGEGGGVEVGTEGDSFFAVFTTPNGAVRAAVAAQRGLEEQNWSPDPAPRVRMGVHTGDGVLSEDDYVGMDVHRASRIAGAAHGGQVLISGATCGLVERELPDGVSLRDMGEHRLKDIAHPEHLHQLVIEGLRADFPPPATLDARPNNLPAQLTSFVGREEEIAEVRELLGRTRLLTLTGPGGTGKSRLALRVAEETMTEYRDGAFFVDLSSVTDPALVPSAVAGVLEVRDVPGRSIVDVVREHLAEKELLLVVDNFEQVAEAAPVVEELLAGAAGLKVITTSRVTLSVRGEQEYLVPPLSPPDPDRLPDLDTLRRSEAVRLFTERAAAADPRFEVTEENAPAVAGITARLDGLPLAIELAATRTKVLTPEQILPRLERRLSILTTGARSLPERQRTLRDAIAWSHDLLEESERRLFAGLSVFSGGWSLSVAEAVCDPVGLDILEGLTSLVDKSLVTRMEPNGEPRFAMLETIREFALERLSEDGEGDLIRRRHGERFLDFAMEAEPHLTSDEQGEWLDRCDREHANIRAALRWAIDAGEAERAQRAAGALWRFWQQRGHLTEAARWFEDILALPSGGTEARAAALIGAGGVAWWRRDRDAAGTFYEEAVAIEREVGDPGRIAEALFNLSFVVAGEDIEGAARLLDESRDLYHRAGDERGVAQALGMLVIRDAQTGDWGAVVTKLEEVVAIFRRVGERLQMAFNMVWLAIAYGRQGRPDEARATAMEALAYFTEVDNPTGIGITFSDLAFLATWEGRHEDAIRFAAAAESVYERIGGPPGGFAGLLEGDPAAEARTHLSDDVADRAWEEGRAMSVDDAVAFATRVAGGG